VYANQAAARALGFDNADALLSASLGEVMGKFELMDEQGAPFPTENLPGRLALQGMYSPETVIRFRNVDTGEDRYSVVKARPVFDAEGGVRLAVNIFRDITDAKMAEAEREELLRRAEAARAEAEASADNLWAIHRVTDVALSHLELDELLAELLERVRETLGTDVAAILLVTRDGSELRLRAASGYDQPSDDLLIAMGCGISGRIASTRRAVTAENLSEEEVAEALLPSSGVRALAGVPLIVEGRVIGVVQVGAREARSFDQRDVGILHLVGDRIAFAIERARAFRAEHRALERSELAVDRISRLLDVTGALSQAATVSQVAEVIIDQGLGAMGARSGSLALLSEDGSEVEIVASIGYPDDVIARWKRFAASANIPIANAIRARELVLISSREELVSSYPHLSPVDEGHAAFAVIPLLSEGRALGALALSFHEPPDFSRVQRAFMQSLGQQCAQALERARLYEDAQAAHAEAEIQRERIAFLAQASELLNASLDVQETLASIARLAVPRISDWCVVEMAESNGVSHSTTIVHSDESKVALAGELRRRYPEEADAPTGTPHVLRSGESELYPEVTDEMLVAAAKDPKHLELLRALNLTSVMLVPLKTQGRTFGVITLASSQPNRRFGPQDLVFAESLARRASAAIMNARLFRETEESRERFAYLARTLQHSLLPERVGVVPGMEAAVRYRAAAEGTQVGGDFYDLFPTRPGEWAVVVGDVIGKGARAAALTGLARHTIRAVATMEPTPSFILSRLNDAILRESEDERVPKFCTVAYARLQPGIGRAHLTVSSGGHPLPYVVRADGSVARAGEPGLLLGVFPDADLTEHGVDLGAKDAIVFYTDGVTEGRRENKEAFGDARLRALLETCGGLDADTIAERIERAVMEFSPEQRLDDVAVLVLTVIPEIAS
jgi:serine phosphatase RsbU (regulator of sigma subunit)/putative methionine-R-sulfoxide reductase with GAF domain